MEFCTKPMFGLELKKQLLQKKDTIEISKWAYSTYLDCCGKADNGLLKVMLDLTTMELGEQFVLSYKMLNKIADDLIADKEIDLNAPEYRED